MARQLQNRLVHVLLLLVLSIALLTGIRGVDFGEHWDEDRILYAVSQSIETGLMLPRWYNYSSVTYDLSLLCLLPELVRYHSPLRASPGSFQPPPTLTNDSNAEHLQPVDRPMSSHTRKEHLLRTTAASHAFKLRVRCVFIIVSLASMIWTYLLVLFWRNNWVEALLASSLLGLSWEVAYHARWIAPDAIQIQFGALTLMCCVFAQERICRLKPTSWLVLAAIAAGLACGTKYQGGLLMLPVLIAAYVNANLHKVSLKQMPWCSFGRLLVIFGLSYLITTPGTIVEPYKFAHNVLFEMRHYRSGHWGHTASAGIHHVFLIFIYLFFVVFSKYAVIALMFAIMACVGAYSLAKEEKKTACIFLSFPVCYILYMGFQNVMIVRNLLILIPFLSILSARGALFLQRRYFKSGLPCTGFAIIVIAALLMNIMWLSKAADTIRQRNRSNDMKELACYIEEHADTRFALSSHVYDDYSSLNWAIPENVVSGLTNDAMAVFYSSDASIMRAGWPANKWNYYRLLPSGPYEVNFDYYPDWIGYDRVVILPGREAKRLRVVLR